SKVIFPTPLLCFFLRPNVWHEARLRSSRRVHTRCSNPNVPGYKDYGGRGIAVCSEWADFQRFQRWALENGYQDDLSIERKDSDLGYSPSNCVWATPTTQSRNRRFVAKAPDGRPWSLVARENGITVSAYR